MSTNNESSWLRDGDQLRCRVQVAPIMHETARAFVLHQLRSLRAIPAGFHHPVDVELSDGDLVLRFAEGALDAPLGARPGLRWREDVLLPLLVGMVDCHRKRVAGLGPVVGDRWVVPVGWFLPPPTDEGFEARRRADLRYMLAWATEGASRHAELGGLLDALFAALDEGEAARLARLIAEDVQAAARADVERPPAPSFLALLTEGELLERVTTLYRYRLLRPHEAEEFGASADGQVVLEVDRGWRDPHFDGLARPTPQAVWDALVEDSKVTPILAASATLPNPLSAAVGAAKLVRWIGVHADQPLLFVDTEGARLPPTGFVRLHLAGDNALMGRKRVATAFAGRHPALAAALVAPPTLRPFGHNPQAREELEDAILATRGVFAVQGPPGTGKTHLATQVVRRLLARTPSARVLVCAKEHFALDHILGKITCALATDGVDVRAWRSVSLARRRKGGGSVDATWQSPNVVRDLGGRGWSPEAAGWSAWETRAGDQHDERLASLGRDAANLFFATTMDGALIDALGNTSFDLVIVEEAGKCYPSELLHALCLGRTALMIGDHRQLPPFQEKRTREGVDAWRKTLGRARREEAFRDSLVERFGAEFLSLEALAEARGPLTDEEQAWLRPFEFLFDRLPTRHRLEEQFRMEAPLSRVVGSVFYDRPFVHRKGELVAAGHLPARPLGDAVPPDLDVPLLWIDTPHMTEHPDATEDDRKRGVRDNRYEHDVVVRYLRHLRPSRSLDLVLLTPYNNQKALFLASPDLRAACARLTEVPFDQVVRTTDEYQGREAELTVLSLVRNNSLGQRAWGFMTELERLNVMFSRSRFRQVVVGSSAHIERHRAECEWLHRVWTAYQDEARDPHCARILGARALLSSEVSDG
jgi:hypothetical protein